MTWIKICGVTSPQDALAATELGASAIGLIFAESPRRVSIDQARTIAAAVRGRAEIVGVFKEVSLVGPIHLAVGLDRAQIHSAEPIDVPLRVLRVIRPNEIGPHLGAIEGEMTLIDGSEGQGKTFDWTLARLVPAPFVLAGGLTPENVGRAIAVAKPFGVDVTSGVEAAPGLKDMDKLRRFFDAVRRADDAR